MSESLFARATSAIAANPRRNEVYTANANSDTVSVIDTRQDRVIRTMPVGLARGARVGEQEHDRVVGHRAGLAGPAGHAGNQQWRGQRPAPQRNREVDIGQCPLRQRTRNDLDVGQSRGEVRETDIGVECQPQMVALAPFVVAAHRH